MTSRTSLARRAVRCQRRWDPRAPLLGFAGHADADLPRRPLPRKTSSRPVVANRLKPPAARLDAERYSPAQAPVPPPAEWGRSGIRRHKRPQPAILIAAVLNPTLYKPELPWLFLAQVLRDPRFMDPQVGVNVVYYAFTHYLRETRKHRK